MKKVKIYLVASSILALLLFSMTTTPSQNISSEFSRLTTANPASQAPRKPKAKFNKVKNSIPNKYIVVLNDDVVSPGASLNVRRSQVKDVAENLAQLYGGRSGFIYDTALKGFSIELPGEAVAVALSKHPRVDWVEEEERLQLSDVQSNPPSWGLDRIDQTSLPLNTQYVFNATGAGVRAYVIDSGIRTTHVEFQGRASIRADFIAAGFHFDECIPTATNNDCHGHGTHVAGTIGSASYGVAKSVTIRSVKVCSALFYVGCPVSAILAGVDLTTSDHTSDPTVPVVANMSLGGLSNSSIDTAVQNSINAGVTYVVAAGNENVDAIDRSPAHIPEALTVGASDINDAKATFSNYGQIVDLFAPGTAILSTWKNSDTSTNTIQGTSMATPHVAGAVALYLQGRTAMANCSANPKQGPRTTNGSAIATCPDRVSQFLASNATLDLLTSLPSGTANRLLFTGSLPATTNPIDNGRFFFWQQYVDFLNRDPDTGGLAFYANILTGCGSDAECIKATRAALSANFYRSAEFGQRGGYVANLFNIVFGQRPKTVAELSDQTKVERPHFQEFMTDVLFVSVADADLNAKKDQLADTWLGRSEVQTILSGLSNQAFVQKLETTAGVTLANRNTLISNLDNNIQTRAQVLRAVADSTEVTTKFVLQNFVTMQYIGHLRREPEDCHNSPDPANCGYIFHYNRFPLGGDPHPTQNLITRGFIESSEYRQRFGP